jgi:hypothetical protein
MENKNGTLLILLIVIVILLSWGLTKNYNEQKQPVEVKLYECKEDSLQNVIDSLVSERSIERSEFDSLEKKREGIIRDYEFGLDFIKENHKAAYKDFVRYSMLREEYDRTVEDEFRARVRESWKHVGRKSDYINE